MMNEPVELFYREYGDGPALIILHGLLGAGGNWHSLSRNVFSNDYRVFTPDLRNHGRSPHAEPFDLPAMVADLVHFYEMRGLYDAYVMGHSLGGKVAMQLALEDAGLVSKLIVVDIAPKVYPPSNQYIIDALRSVDLNGMSSRAEVDEALSEEIRSRPVRQFVLKNLGYDNESGQYSWQLGIEEINAGYANVNAAIESDRAYEGPALFIRGERSDYIQDEDLEEIQRLFPHARVETVAGAGHWVHADAPDELAHIVTEFLLE